MHFIRISLYSVIVLAIASCSDSSRTWSKYINNTGTYSSVRTVDLTNDGIPDIILGGGGKEEKSCDTAVLALDGATGKPLWAIPGINQYVGSAVFKDISGDNIPDVFIGGRWAQLAAINGVDGKVIWTFYPQRTNIDGSDGGWYNFTTPQFIPDQDKDGIEDLLIANGGDARAAPGDPNRPVGRLLVLSSKSGKILADVRMPDGRETYLSVVCEKKDDNINVYFGTGGETLPGKLFRTTLAAIMQGDISKATVLASGDTKGFVASPVLADINHDAVSDVIINAVDGRMLAIDGKTDSLLWQVQFPGTEAYTIPAVGLFTNDSIPDFFGNFAIGTFPVLNYSIRFMVDGATGHIQFQDTVPSFQYASAVAADINADGFDEVIINQSALQRKQFEHVYYCYLFAFDFKNHTRIPLGDTLQATNLASTPWIGDLDGDNRFDIVYTAVKYDGVKFDIQQPLLLWIGRYKSNITITRPPAWGAYMGSGYDGIYNTAVSH